MEELFSKHAPLYWSEGLPVIPLRIMTKKPLSNEWTRYAKEMVSPYIQESWLNQYKQNNIGLPLGSESNIVAIDIDTRDEKISDMILKLLPQSPWVRVGQKGCVIAFRYNGEDINRIRDKHGNTIVEILSTGSQIVLPPSIHPDTGLPYTSNTNLYEVHKDLPKLPDSLIDRLRAMLSTVIELAPTGGKTKFNMKDFVELGSRDVQMTKMAGYLSLCVIKGDCTLFDALNDMQIWCAEKTTAVPNDPLDAQKGISKVVEFLRKDVERGAILPPAWDESLTPEQKETWSINFGEDKEEWTFNQITDYLKTKFSEIESVEDPGRFKIVSFALNKINNSSHLKELEIGVLLNTLKKHSGMNLPISYFVKELKALKKLDMEGLNHTEIANATIDLFKERRGGHLAYWQEQFWEWSGHCWVKVPTQALWNIISQTFGSLNAARKASDHQGIIRVIQNIVPQFLTANQGEGVNFTNGYLNQELQLIPHQPEQGMTYILPFEYRAELSGKFPKFISFLKDSWGHHSDYVEKEKALQEAMAVTLFSKATSFQKAFLLYGLGGTGKSVILDIIDNLVPEEARCAIPPNKWAEKFTGSQFSGKLINHAGELDERRKINGQMFKSIVSGEPMQVEFKNKDPFMFSPRTAHWFASNELPKSDDISLGFNRRWLILGFDKIVESKDKILDYGKIIAFEEMEAIAAWAVEALPELLQRNDFTLPSSHFTYVEEMSLGNSPVRQWFNTNLIITHSNKDAVLFKDLYRDYWAFSSCHSGGKQVSSMTQFKIQLQQILLEQKVYEEQSETYYNIKLARKA